MFPMRGSGASAGEEYPSDVLEGFLDVSESPGCRCSYFMLQAHPCPQVCWGRVAVAPSLPSP